VTVCQQQIQNRQVTREDQVFGVFDVCVFHVPIIGTGSGVLGAVLCHLVNWFGRLTWV
jgi:hypothetical protein